jgi:hypothetical protein
MIFLSSRNVGRDARHAPRPRRMACQVLALLSELSRADLDFVA